MIPSLTFQGSMRLQIEAVRVKKQFRGQDIGKWMIAQAINYGKARGAKMIQLTTNKKRSDAKRLALD
jgi:ribosomal protein S18 acetylase RimI-like enzyme